ncbi:hypothetical protein [Herpetosiphon sp. NSE202]|uniref:hypothetical protein n=1 Tax=Herpetosiphon sp. NSE202 TaxID=3351349 RepID=UPI003625B23A
MLYLACAVYCSTLALGASVQYLHLRLGRWRWLHHALFFATWLSTGAAIVWAWWYQLERWWLASLIIPILALFPLRRASSRWHRWLGISGLGVWAMILALASV